MRTRSLVSALVRFMASFGLVAACAFPAAASAATTLSTTGISTDNLTANGNVTFNDASADTIVIGQNGSTPDIVQIAGDVSLTDPNWGVTAAGAATFGSVNGLTLVANTDGFQLSGGSTNSRTLMITGGNITFNATGATSVTLPTSGTLAATDVAQAWSGAQTFNGGITAATLTVNPATKDPISIVPLTGSNGDFTGTITFADLTTSNKTWTFPNAGGAVVIDSATQTLTNKTLTSPAISSIVNTGTLTLPTSNDTLVGRATTDTLTNKTLTSPRIGTAIVDTNGAAILTLAPLASAVNAFSMSNANAGFPVTLAATGTDADISMLVLPKGNGEVIVSNGVTNADQLAIRAQVSSVIAGNMGTLTSADLTAARTWTLPNNGGTIALTSDIPASVTGTGSNGNVAFWSGSTALSDDSNFFWDNTGKRLGIGASSPAQKLEIGNGNILVDRHPASGLPRSNYIGVGDISGNFADNTAGASMKILSVSDNSNSSQSLHFITHHSGVNAGVRMSIDIDGNVGIGDDTPAAMLTVGSGDAFQVSSAGNVTTTGNINANGHANLGNDANVDLVTLTATTHLNGPLQMRNQDFSGAGTDDATAEWDGSPVVTFTGTATQAFNLGLCGGSNFGRIVTLLAKTAQTKTVNATNAVAVRRIDGTSSNLQLANTSGGDTVSATLFCPASGTSEWLVLHQTIR